jgi:hypothetical protein
LKVDQYRSSAGRQVVQAPPVSAMPPGGWFPALVTGGLRGPRPRGDHDTILSFGNAIDLHVLQIREEQIDAARVLTHAGMQHNDLAAAR